LIIFLSKYSAVGEVIFFCKYKNNLEKIFAMNKNKFKMNNLEIISAMKNLEKIE